MMRNDGKRIFIKFFPRSTFDLILDCGGERRIKIQVERFESKWELTQWSNEFNGN